MYECFHCCEKTATWLADFDFEDYGIEGQGIVHELICTNCGARITYYVSVPDEDDIVFDENECEKEDSNG